MTRARLLSARLAATALVRPPAATPRTRCRGRGPSRGAPRRGSFPQDATLFLSAAASSTSADPLLCVRTSADPSQGAYVGGRVTQATLSVPPCDLGACASQYRLAAWPPPEDDPETGNLMIRVG